jgi:hypothetical protein
MLRVRNCIVEVNYNLFLGSSFFRIEELTDDVRVVTIGSLIIQDDEMDFTTIIRDSMR